MARVKDLTKPQARIWRAARAYAKSELAYAAEHDYYRSTGDPAGMPHAETARQRASSRLFRVIQTALIVDPEE